MSLSVPIWVLLLNWRRHTSFFPSKHMHVFKRAVSQNKRLFRVALTVMKKKVPSSKISLSPTFKIALQVRVPGMHMRAGGGSYRFE